MGETLTHWTIRLALVCLALRLAGQLRFGASPQWFGWMRNIWTTGLVFFVAHVACAFHFYHGWSHARAVETTAQQTHAMLGVRFGEGIYFSYLFALLWAGDVLWQWLSPESYRQRSVAITVALLSYMAFIAFNGAVIFEGGVTRWVGIPVAVALVLAWSVALVASWRRGVKESHSGRWSPVSDPSSPA
jgi:hypothetical protein